MSAVDRTGEKKNKKKANGKAKGGKEPVQPLKKEAVNNKTGGGKKKKKMVPLQLFAAAKDGFQGVETDEVDSSVMYHKSVTAAVQIYAKNIKKRGETLDSFDVLMFLPGYGALTGSGTLCDLMGSTYLITNPSPYTITIRAQRPMGFKDDVSSLAMWEPLGNDLIYEIAPRGELKLGSSNGATSHMTPRELTKRGKRCVHLLSFSVFREPLSDYGTAPTEAQMADEVGLVLEMITRYKCMNGDVGQVDSYVVESFKGANRLNHVNVGPLVDMRFSDLNIPQGTVTKIFVSTTKDLRLQLTFSSGDSDQVMEPDLDKNTIYGVSCPIMMLYNPNKTLGTARHIGWTQSGSSTGYWTYGFLEGDTTRFTQGVVAKDYYVPGNLGAGEWLTPIAPTVKSSLSCRKKNSITCVQHNTVKIRGSDSLQQLDAGILETLVKGLVIIYEVTKVAVEILGVVGVIANPDLKSVESVKQTIG